MKVILKIFTLKRTLLFSIVILAFLIVFNFYGPYTNKFYFFKPANFILPILSIGHFIFLYVLWFKVKEEETTDPQMRNLEYVLYIIFLVYVYKACESIYILSTYWDYEFHLLPSAFLPLSILILTLYLILIGLSALVIIYRKNSVGNYKFDDINHIDSWE